MRLLGSVGEIPAPEEMGKRECAAHRPTTLSRVRSLDACLLRAHSVRDAIAGNPDFSSQLLDKYLLAPPSPSVTYNHVPSSNQLLPPFGKYPILSSSLTKPSFEPGSSDSKSYDSKCFLFNISGLKPQAPPSAPARSLS